MFSLLWCRVISPTFSSHTRHGSTVLKLMSSNYTHPWYSCDSNLACDTSAKTLIKKEMPNFPRMMFLYYSALLLLISSDFCLTAKILTRKAENRRADQCRNLLKCELCEKHFKPMDCSEIFENGNTESGIYTIWPRHRLANCSSIEVYCDMDTTGGGWTVIQRRGDYGNGEDYFTKNWEQYKAGFGNLKMEFWLGNDNIFLLTNQAQYSIRFDMTHGNGKTAFTLYENFWIDDEEKMYTLHISEASGPGGGAISNHDGCPFYTRDRPNRLDGKKLPKMHYGGWWNNAYPSSTLNGLNKNGQKITEMDGIQWMNFGGFYNSLAATEMKVRPKRFHAK